MRPPQLGFGVHSGELEPMGEPCRAPVQRLQAVLGRDPAACSCRGGDAKCRATSCGAGWVLTRATWFLFLSRSGMAERVRIQDGPWGCPDGFCLPRGASADSCSSSAQCVSILSACLFSTGQMVPTGCHLQGGFQGRLSANILILKLLGKGEEKRCVSTEQISV